MDVIVSFGTIIAGFIFSIYYICSLFDEKHKGGLVYKIIGGFFFIFFVMLVYGLIAMPPYVKCVRYDNRYIRCIKTNVRQIQFAVEMYNMDHDNLNQMHVLDMDLLKKEGYIEKLEDSYSDCEYYNEGDLTKDGFYIVCKKCGNYELNEKKKKENREREKKTFKGFCISLASFITGFPY